MINFRIFSVILGVTMIGQPSVAIPESHQPILDALDKVGVSVDINNIFECSKGFDGAYISPQKKLVVCITGKNNQVSPNDLDTIRHEAQHVIQDCIQGKMGDATYRPMFDDSQLGSFVRNSGLTPGQVNAIVERYRSHKAYREEDIKLEVEAFAVAMSIKPDLIARKILDSCPLVNQ